MLCRFCSSDLPESPESDALSPVYYGQSPGKHLPPVPVPVTSSVAARGATSAAAAEAAVKYPDLNTVDYTLPLQIIQEEQYVKTEAQESQVRSICWINIKHGMI